MPFLHWETSRQRQRFAQEIDRIIFSEKDGLRNQELDEKKKRQDHRKGLPRCSLRKFDRPKSSSGSSNTTSPAKKDHEEIPRLAGLQHLYATGKLPSLEVAVQLLKKIQLKKIGPYPEMDENRRLEVTHPLGQYLIDAARLFEGMTSYRDKKLLGKYLCHDPPLHPRRTLDQAYYWTLDTSRTRDRDQVIYRATTTPSGKFHRFTPEKGWEGHENLEGNEACDKCRDNIRRVSRVVMVDQLWMWILDERTIITCFPKRCV